MKKIFLFLLFILAGIICFAQTGLLKQEIEHILEGKNATVGVAIMDLNTGDTLTVNNDSHVYPTMSVYKFYLALAVLDQVDKGKLALDQPIAITPSDLLPNTHSPLRDEHPAGGFSLSVAELLSYTVLQSDNNGCDILFRLLGGPEKVDQYIRKTGIRGISIRTTEAQMHESFEQQYTNTTTPWAAVQTLDLVFQKHQLLSDRSREFLWKMMAETSTGKDKLKGLLPAGAVVAHKTGSSFRSETGLNAAENDIGILVLPSGKRIAVAVLVADSMEPYETNAKMIAEVAKSVWDFFEKK